MERKRLLDTHVQSAKHHRWYQWHVEELACVALFRLPFFVTPFFILPQR